MADFSLDDYMVKKGTRFPNKMRGRLGVKKTPGRAAVAGVQQQQQQQQGAKWKRAPPQQQQVVVKGLGKVQGFDARQKLGKKVPQDARMKLQQKTKFADARIKIANKQVQAQRSVTNKKNLGTNDMRIKINNSLAKKTDARGMIQKKVNQKQQQQQQQQQKRQGQGIQMNMGGPGSGVISGPGGSLMKTISSGPQGVHRQQGGMGMMGQQQQQGGVNMMGQQRQQGGVNMMGQQRQGGVNMMGQQRQQGGVGMMGMANPGMLTRTIVNPVQNFQAHQQQQQQQPYMGQQQVEYMGNEDMFMNAMGNMPQQQMPQQMQMHTGPMSYGGLGQHQVQMQNEYYQQPPQAQPIPTVTGFRKKVKRAPVPPAVAPMAMPMPVQQQQQQRVQSAPGPSATDVYSPLQGFRVQVTNLHPSVSQEDVVELFGSIGAMKKARLIKAGLAEVVFVKRDEAIAAVRKYHMRELDGEPMHVVMTSKNTPKHHPAPTETSQPLRLGKPASSMEGLVDPNILHKALFRTQNKSEQQVRPVSFTVKI